MGDGRSESLGTSPGAGVSATSSESLYRPVRARAYLAGSALLLGATIRWALDLPLEPAFFAVIVGWFAVSATALRWVLPSPGVFDPSGAVDLDDSPQSGLSADRSDFATSVLPRLVLFAFEVVVAVWIARFISASSWPAILLVLLPAVEWSMLYPGLAGLVGSVGAVLGSGAVVLGEVLGFVPASTLLPVVDDGFADPAHGLMAFLLALVLVVALSRLVGRYAEASRRKSAELDALNRRLEEMARDVRISHDETRHAYQELQQAQAELVSSARMATLGNLIRGVAHEINTPLGALASNHDVADRALKRLQVILEDEVVEEDELDEVRRIVRAVDGVQATSSMAVDRMKKLVRDLRTFGRPDRSEIDRVDLNEILESALDLLQHELSERITVQKELSTLPRVECYPHKLSQVFMNLLLNAIQAMPEGGEITVVTEVADPGSTESAGKVDGARREAAEAEDAPEGGPGKRVARPVVIRIRDTGVGIPRENLERIFEPGFSTKGARVGMGLGLIISAQIMEEHGGRISVESEVGGGTEFTLALPLRMSKEGIPDDPSPPKASGPPRESAGSARPAGSRSSSKT